MRVKISLSPRLLILLLFVEAILVLASVLVFLRLDSVVNNTLYEFGLQFSYVWAEPYWSYSELILGSLGVTTILSCIAIAYVQISSRSGISPKVWFVGALIFAVTIASAASAIFFTRVDAIVNGDLYRYGLQFSYTWANQYWAYARFLLGSIGFIILLNSGLMGSLIAKHGAVNITLSKLATGLLLAGGSLAIALSLFFESSILALIGLGFVFWGAVLFYVEPQEYISEDIAALMAIPPLVSLNQMLQHLGYQGKTFYLPPEYLQDRRSSKVYISSNPDAAPPTRESISEREDPFLNSPKAVIIEPPGMELSRLFEKTLKTKFENTDLQFVQDNLPDLMVDDLGIARRLRISIDGNLIRVEVQGIVCRDICRKVRSLTGLYGHVGCPVSSALGCAFAKAASKLVTIEREQISEDGRNLVVEYLQIDETNERN